ncbi:ImuA family protein [Roseovarius aestuarii]|uniref:ImuA family protein n=1 Tax=Roseovarius aestuarii TaxID=475083 RepID=UPI000A26753C|nr:hypothetical protein [Roseovarius aestuarii]
MTDRVFPYFPLREGRAHEVCGAGSLVFACAVGASVNGPVLWVNESWVSHRINPDGLREFFDPGRVLMAQAKDQAEVLATAEEALRSGAVALVVMELTKPLGLTAGRRLQLAAEAGKTLALSILPEGMGSNTAETRWQCVPVYDVDDSTLQRWEIIKNKSRTYGAWHVRWDAASRRVIMVSPARQRPGSAGTTR